MKFSFFIYRYACKRLDRVNNVKNVSDADAASLLTLITFLTLPARVHVHESLIRRMDVGALAMTCRKVRGSFLALLGAGNSRPGHGLATGLPKGVK